MYYNLSAKTKVLIVVKANKGAIMKCYYTAIQIPEIKKKNAMFEAFGTHTLSLRVQIVQ